MIRLTIELVALMLLSAADDAARKRPLAISPLTSLPAVAAAVGAIGLLTMLALLASLRA